MQTKIGYYPLLDAALAMRQIFSVERFKPFCPSLEIIDSRITKEDREQVMSIAPFTEEWLDVIKNLIDLTMEGIVSTEELFLKAFHSPALFFGHSGTSEHVDFLSEIFYNHVSVEASKYTKQIRKKSIEISEASSTQGIIDYILSLSDRFEKTDSNRIKFNIKPELSVSIEDIETIIVMPSVFSSRNVSFWYSGNVFLFFVALDSKVMSLEEPSDMLLLRTLAFNDKTRLKMLKTLAHSALSANEMAEIMGVNASTVSRHFKVFKDTGFVDIQSQEGNSVYYSINENEIKKSIETIYDYIFRRNDL